MKADWGTGAWLKGTPGPEIVKELTPRKGDIIVEGKMTLDAFHSTALDYLLRANQIEYVAFTGFHTNWCVESSARSAYDKGYRVHVISDCTATDTAEEQNYAEKWDLPEDRESHDIQGISRFPRIGRHRRRTARRGGRGMRLARRMAIAGIGLAAAWMLLCPRGGSGGADKVKVGFMFGMTGAASPIGPVQLDGAKLAVKEINAGGGVMLGGKKVPVEFVVRDDETKPDIAIRRFRELLTEEKVHLIVGQTFAPISGR